MMTGLFGGPFAFGLSIRRWLGGRAHAGISPRRPPPKQPNSQTHQPARAGCSFTPPLSPAEERTALRPRAQHASRTDSAQLFDQSVAAGVLRGASRTAHRRVPLASARGWRFGGDSLPTFWSPRKWVARRGELPAGPRHQTQRLLATTNAPKAAAAPRAGTARHPNCASSTDPSAAPLAIPTNMQLTSTALSRLLDAGSRL